MPTSSRKRNKGKERKAKQALIKQEKDKARVQYLWRGWVLGDPHIMHRPSNIQCIHGCDYPIDERDHERDHPVAIFMDAFFSSWYNKGTSVLQTIEDIFQAQQDVFVSEHYREMAIKILTRIGTNMLLTKEYQDLGICVCIMVLENYCGHNIVDFFNCRAVATKLRDLDRNTSSYNRDLIKFFRKRISCSCLKEMHLEARESTPKMGGCFGCGKEKERVLLDVCSRCMVNQYCSRKCQVADWDKHRNDCDILFSNHQQHIR